MSIVDTSSNQQRLTNAAACLQVLRDRAEPLTISHLASATGLSRPTVEAVLRDLTERSPVADHDRALASGAGRPARRFSFDAAAGSVAGIDAGPNTLRLTLTDLAGTVLTRAQADVDPGLTTRARLTALRRLVTTAVESTDAGPLRAAGIGVPGILDHDQRITHSLALPEWVGYPLLARLSTALDCPVVGENDIKLAALAEHRLRGSQAHHLVFLQIGHRISLASVVNGHLLQGSHRIAGELGTLRGMRWTSSSHRGQLRWRSAATAEQVFSLATDGDIAAQEEIHAFCEEIAPLIGTILLTLDPDLVVVGGGLSRAGRTLLDPLTTAVHHVLTIDARPALVGSLLRSDGPSSGAVGSAFEQLGHEIVGIPGVTPPWGRWLPVIPTNPASSTTHPSKESP